MLFQNYINREFTTSGEGARFTKESPFTGEVLGEGSLSSALDFVQALQGAKKATGAMRALTPDQRREALLKMAQALENEKLSISLQEALHQGLPTSFILENSIEPSIKLLKQIAAELESGDSPNRQPTGVLAVIPSWCLSLFLAIERLGPALAAGNCVLVKASELSPITGLLLAQILDSTDLPPGAVQILYGDGEISQLMMSHPGIRGVSLVGRQSTYESGAKSNLSQLKKIQYAGSTKNVSAVIGGFDFKKHFPELLKSFLLGQGQLCWNASRLIILESMADEFYAELERFISDLTPLLDPRGESIWTPLISRETEKRTLALQESAILEKGHLMAQPKSNSEGGFFTKPVFIRDLTNCSLLHQNELQAPVFLVNTVKYQHEISKWVNNYYLGHSTFIWGDSERALKVSQTLDVAHVGINQWRPGLMGSVFGHKQSSFGSLDRSWRGSFYSDVKFLTMLEE